MAQLRISDKVHQRLVVHCSRSRRSLRAEAEYAILALCDGQIYTALAIDSRGDSKIVVSISCSGGPDVELDKFSVESVGGIVSRGISLKNCSAYGKVAGLSETDEASGWLKGKGYAGTIGQQVSELLSHVEAMESAVGKE